MSQNSTEVVNCLSPGGVTDSDSVASWISHVASPNILSVSRAYHIVSAIWYKEKTGAQHEALELKVAGGPQNKNTLWFLVERGGVITRTRTTPSPSSTPNSSTASLNRSADSSGQLSSQRIAKDTIAVHAASPISGTLSNYHPVATLVIPPDSRNPLTACDLAALLSVVSQSRPEYNVISFNCYWFAAMIIGAIEVVHNGHVEFTKTGTSAGHLGIFRIVKSEDVKGGVQEVVPTWAALKAIYQIVKTTQENEREVEARVKREVDARQEAEARAEREVEARRESSEARRESSEAQKAELEALKAENRALRAKVAQLPENRPPPSS